MELLHQSNAIICYTDGTQLDGKPGTRVGIYQNTSDVDKKVISYHLGKLSIVFQAETIGIERAAGKLVGNRKHRKRYMCLN